MELFQIGREIYNLAKDNEPNDTMEAVFNNPKYMEEGLSKERTPLHIAAKTNGKAVQNFLNSIQDPSQRIAAANARDKNGITPLHLAAHVGNISAIFTFLTAGADIHLRDKNNWNALHWAVYGHKIKSVQVLILNIPNHEQKANFVNTTTIHKTTDEPDSFLSGWTALHLAAYENYSDIINVLITAQAEIDAIDAKGRTPLHVAIIRGNVNAVQALINAGADVNVTIDIDGETYNALSLLKLCKLNKYKRNQIAKMLIKAGVEIPEDMREFANQVQRCSCCTIQ